MVEEIRRNTPPHMIRTRLYGEDMLGEGSIFPVEESIITEPPLTYIPEEWFKIWGIDFGIGHPFAAVLILYHAEADTIHVHHCIRLKDQTPLQHAVPMKAIGADVVVAYPRDGDSRQMGSGEPLAELYRKEDLRLINEAARFDDGSNSTDRGNLEIWQRMTTGRKSLALAALLLAPVQARAEAPDRSANYWLPHCQDALKETVPPDKVFLAGVCVGILLAAGATLQQTSLQCPPAGVSINQAVRVVVAYIEAHPARMHEDFIALAGEAAAAAWPCKK
jgi:hypothetical protein